jgi:hypothetical protein
MDRRWRAFGGSDQNLPAGREVVLDSQTAEKTEKKYPERRTVVARLWAP